MIPVHRVQRVRLDHPVLPVRWDHLDQMELQVDLVLRDPRDHPVEMVVTVCLVLLVLLVLRVRLVCLVSLVLLVLQDGGVIRDLQVKRVMPVTMVWL